MMNDTEAREYDKRLQRYYRDQLATLSVTEGYLSCKGCSQELLFSVGQGTLVCSCGSAGEGTCGTQYEITLPKYVRYTPSYKKLAESENGTLPYNDDIHDLSQQDLTKLCALTDMSLTKEKKAQDREVVECQTHQKELRKLYESQNAYRDKRQLLQELATLQTHLHDEKLRLQKRMREENDIPREQELRRQYARLCMREETEVKPLLQELRAPDTDTVMIQGPSYKDKNTTYQEPVKKAYPKTPVKTKTLPKTPAKISEDESESSEDEDEVGMEDFVVISPRRRCMMTN